MTKLACCTGPVSAPKWWTVDCALCIFIGFCWMINVSPCLSKGFFILSESMIYDRAADSNILSILPQDWRKRERKKTTHKKTKTFIIYIHVYDQRTAAPFSVKEWNNATPGREHLTTQCKVCYKLFCQSSHRPYLMEMKKERREKKSFANILTYLWFL